MTCPLAPARRGTVLVTGVGRRRGIAATVALRLAQEGWDLALSHLSSYDERLGLERGADDPAAVAAACREAGASVALLDADLAQPDVPARLVDRAAEHGNLTALVLSHCESVDSSVLTTTVESWDRHFAVNARASWLLVKAFAERLSADAARERRGRIVALTSDHVVHNLPYGASKAALDRLMIASAVELAGRGISANAINPGPIDTGWMDDATRSQLAGRTPGGVLGTPQDTADLICFLLSERGGWVTGQVLTSNGGFGLG